MHHARGNVGRIARPEDAFFFFHPLFDFAGNDVDDLFEFRVGVKVVTFTGGQGGLANLEGLGLGEIGSAEPVISPPLVLFFNSLDGGDKAEGGRTHELKV